jgi:N-acetylmuramic acid 6-phosphate (MurNAc-6-P) etherase
MAVTNCTRTEAMDALAQTDGKAKEAILVVALKITAADAKKLLKKCNGFLSTALEGGMPS